MSNENKKTVKAYQKKAKQYLFNNSIIDPIDIKKETNKTHYFIRNSLKYLPCGSKILEIGAGNGDNSLYIKKLGYNITSSDIADDFLKEIEKRGLSPIKFNLLEDSFKEKYDGIFCWKVFVHFTDEDMLYSLNKIYNSLNKDGILIFSLINRNCKENDSEWIDFPDEYSMGVDRYFRYYSKKDMDKIINKTNFKVLEFHRFIGLANIKWFIYVLRKED